MPLRGMNQNQNQNQSQNAPEGAGDLIYVGQAWVAEAIAQQEEHLRRVRCCSGSREKSEPVIGLAHSWDQFSPAPGASPYQACWRCGVTRTLEDWERRTAQST